MDYLFFNFSVLLGYIPSQANMAVCVIIHNKMVSLLSECVRNKRSWTCIKSSHQWMTALQCHCQPVVSFPLVPSSSHTTFSFVAAPIYFCCCSDGQIVTRSSDGDFTRRQCIPFLWRKNGLWIVSWMTCFITNKVVLHRRFLPCEEFKTVLLHLNMFPGNIQFHFFVLL